MTDTTHECPKNGCKARVSRSQFACRRHWYEVSKETRQAIYEAYRSGDTGAHMEAMGDAIEELNG